jgi:uncharacterized membrane protein
LDGNLYNAWRFTALTPWPRWAVALFFIGAVAAVLLAHKGLRTETRRPRRIALVTLRAVSALVALFLLLEPAVQLLQTARVKNRLAVLVDTSRSMNFPVAPGGDARAAVAAEWVKSNRNRLEQLGDRVALEWYAFDKDLVPAEAGTLAGGLQARGGKSDLLGALKAVAAGGAGAAGRKLAGAVLISDGADNTTLGAGLSRQAREELESLGAPVTAVAVGATAPRDLAVERVAVDDFAFVRNTLTIEATLKARGFQRETVQLVLRREGSVVAAHSVQLEPGKESYTVPLSFAPDTTGTFVFTVAAPILPDEAVAENNSRSFVLRVIRDRVRVLLVAGRPSWDERFLRGLLKQDPNIDLISFFILRTGTDNAGPNHELSLIPFPVAEIFGEQLRTFDAVLFVNFAYQPYRALDIDRYLPNLRDYVKGGGAFAMVGGEQSFGEGHYGITPLQEILPVEALEGAGFTTEPFKPRLTPDGRRHPVTQLAGGEAANEAAWSALPPVPGLNLTRPAAGARVLLESPLNLLQGRPTPLVAVREVGAGRSLAVATDATWHWGFVAAEGGGGNRSYQRFWNNALRWLVRDPALTPVQVEPDKPEVEPGDPVGLSVSVRSSDYGPGAGAEIAVELVSADDGKVVSRAKGVAGSDGTAHVEIAPPKPGAYKVVASTGSGTTAQVATGAVAVRAAGPEDADAAPRPELMRAIAETTGGSFVPLPPGSWPEL